MKTSILLALASVCSQIASAAVQFSFVKQRTSDDKTITGSTGRSLNTGLSYQDATYVVNVTVGTPGQPESLQLSTSSSDTWVVDARSEWCTYSYAYAWREDDNTTDSDYCPGGTFSPGNSTSFKLLSTSDNDDDTDEQDFSTSYNDGSYVYGEYMSDVFTIDGVTVSNLTMGLVNDTVNRIGVLGIGFNDSTHDNLPDRLQQQGLINSTAYSLWVDDETASSGNLLFGAVDTTKFEGTLTRIMAQYSYYMIYAPVVGINGSTSESGGPIAITASDEESESSSSGSSTSESDGDSYLFTAIFSPPDTVSNLPTDVASQIWQMAGARYDDDLELAVVSCSAAGDTTTNFTLQLGGRGAKGPILSAHMSDLVIPSNEVNMSTYYSSYMVTDDTDDNMCLFGVQNGTSSSGPYNLGSTLLRRTYSVFDLVNNEVAVAPVRFGATSTSNLVPFESYGASVPSSTILCVYSYCYTDSGTGSDDAEDGEGGTTRLSGVLSVPVLIGMSLGIALGCLVLGLAGFLFWRHRRGNSPAAAEGVTSMSRFEAGESAPMMSSVNAPDVAAREMADVSQTPAVAAGKGKAPELSDPLARSSSGELHETAGASDAEGLQDADHGEPSSNRNA